MIDLRSDTVTKPSKAMREAMSIADVGDMIYEDDPTVLALQERMADMVGAEAGLFVPSGTQSNLIALLSHCARGDEYITGHDFHCYKYEGGGAAAFGGIQPQPIEAEPDGTLDLGKVKHFIKVKNDVHFANTKLLCIENTVHGKVLPLDYFPRVRKFCDEHQLGLHLDGARIFNAAIASGVEAKAITRHFDTVSVCLSKGLGAPVGSVLLGSHDFIARSKRWRKMLGGGMRQAGILAAAGLYALDHNIDRLAEDHANAKRLAEALSQYEELNVNPDNVQSNLVFLNEPKAGSDALCAFMKEHGILMGKSYGTLRIVMHLGVSAEDTDKIISGFEEFYAQ